MATIYPVAAERSALEKPRVVCSLSHAAAERQVKQGKLRRVYDLSSLVGYERIPIVAEPFVEAPVAGVNPAADIYSPSPASITSAEMEINAHAYFRDGKSRTAHLHPNAVKRFTRVDAKTGRSLPPEDRVEIVQEKVREFGESRMVCAARRLGEDRVSA